MSYRNNDELAYFGSDLNKFINLECSKEMSVMNIDCVELKVSKRIVRIIEYKHSNEKISKMQLSLLKILANHLNDGLYKFEIYVIRGDPPFDNVLITDLKNNVTYICEDRFTFKKFCNFEINVEDLKKL